MSARATVARCVFALVILAGDMGVAQAAALEASQQIETYSQVAYLNYQEAYEAARKLQTAVDDFVHQSSDDLDESLVHVRQAWLDARPSYGQSEAFRFYEGPIDFIARPDGTQGPEGLINAWPLNESYIDAVVDDENAPITRAALVERNAKDDEADVTTGFHAIEYLLWGPDLSATGPGNRSARDFVGEGKGERRRAYLKVATDLLVDDIHLLVEEWAPNRKDNYRARFQAMPYTESIAKILTGVATLSGFELGYERLATALDSGSQEDEQSCFSDNTPVDVLANATGVANVYFGRYGRYQGTGLNSLVAAVDPQMNDILKEQIAKSLALARQMDRPFDRTLATSPGSPQRAKVEALVTSLQTQARLFTAAGSRLGVNIVVAVENE